MKSQITLTKAFALALLLVAFTQASAFSASNEKECKNARICCRTVMVVKPAKNITVTPVRNADLRAIRIIRLVTVESVTETREPAPLISNSIWDKEMDEMQKTLSAFTSESSISLRNINWDVQTDKVQEELSQMRDQRINFNDLGKETDAVQEELSRIDAR